jgi:cellobiose-specific phosphotransferase system component IIA
VDPRASLIQFEEEKNLFSRMQTLAHPAHSLVTTLTMQQSINTVINVFKDAASYKELT